MLVELPTIKVRADLVKPRHVRSGEIAHCRFEFAPGDTQYVLAPAAIARQWLEVGSTDYSRSLTEGLVRPDQSALGPMAAVRVRFGRETKNFLVPLALARKWASTAREFERLHDDYQRMMAGG